jgi:NADH-quinone oxidoreductase subunit J
MNIIFYIASIIAIISTALVITRKNAVHALLYLIVSLLSVSVIFFILGAPFVAALEVIIYAGAIMVLFIFVIMMLNLGMASVERERNWFSFKAWIGPGILTLILLAEFIYILTTVNKPEIDLAPVGPQQVGFVLFSRYVLGVELTAMLLMSGIIGAYHIGRGKKKEYHRFLQKEGQKREEKKKVLS